MVHPGLFHSDMKNLPKMFLFAIIHIMFSPATGNQEPKLVYPRLLQERSYNGRLVMQIHEGLLLNLRKASVAARNFRVLTVEDGQEVTNFYNGADLEKHLYEDEMKFATVNVIEKDSAHEMEGVLGPYHRIQPAEAMERSDNGLIPHMIYTIEQKKMLDNVLVPSELETSTLEERMADSAVSVPEVVVVEVFIISDSTHHRIFNSTVALTVYLLITINSANMRFSDMNFPKIKLLLTGVEKNRGSTYKSGYGNYMHDSKTLKNLKLYAEGKKGDFGHPDVTYLMTGFDLYYTDNSRKMNTDAQGIGYVAGVCSQFSVALGEDAAGYYSGMHTLTHEVAHVLGATHDESPPTSNIDGHPGAEGCPWSHGYIMSYVNNGSNHHRFSDCSLKQMRFVIRVRRQVCWTVTGQQKIKEERYPGMEISPHAFCQHVFPGKKNVTADMTSPDLKHCKIKCQYPVISYRHYNGELYQVVTTHSLKEDALDFMPCGEGQVCIRGLCIGKPASKPKEAIITQPTSTTEAPTESTTLHESTSKCECDCTTRAPTKKPRNGVYRYPYRSG